MKEFDYNGSKIISGNALEYYDSIKEPMVIISDGAYGIKGFPGDPPTYESLPQWYESHIKKWTDISSYQTTLWFWNTEIGWATIHPILEKYGWRFKNCHIWDKGIGHIAGNVNSKSIKKIPIVTEICVQYIKEPVFYVGKTRLSMKEWLKYEWQRSGFPLSLTNEVCGVKNAATRKYFTQDYHWYMPPVDSFEKIQRYANSHGEKKGLPYFSIDGVNPLSNDEWNKFKPKFNHTHGLTNVWHEPTVNGKERLKNGSKSLHLNQKPLKLIEQIILSSSDENDLVVEPFGGLCTAFLASIKNNRKSIAFEIDEQVFNYAVKRMQDYNNIVKLDF